MRSPSQARHSTRPPRPPQVFSLQTYADNTNTRVAFLSGDLGLLGTGGYANINLDGSLAPENDPATMPTFIASPIGATPAGFDVCSVYNTLGEQSEYLNRNGSTGIYNDTTIEYLVRTCRC